MLLPGWILWELASPGTYMYLDGTREHVGTIQLVCSWSLLFTDFHLELCHLQPSGIGVTGLVCGLPADLRTELLTQPPCLRPACMLQPFTVIGLLSAQLEWPGQVMTE